MAHEVADIEAYIDSLDASIDTLSDTLKPLLGKTLQEITENDEPVARIKAYNNYLYVVISVLFAYLKSTGIKTETHPIMEELARVKKSMSRLKEVEQKLQKGDTSAENSARAKRLIEQTLGNVNGGGAALPDNVISPAISSASFKSLQYQGKHTKFKGEEENGRSDTKGKVTKPKGKAKTKGRKN